MARVRGHGFGDDGSVPPPLVRGRRGRRPGRVRKPPGKIALTFGIIGMLVTFGLGVGAFVSSVSQLPYRAGWAGTAGIASAISCESVPSGRSSEIDCVGSFTATNGRATVAEAGIEGHSSLGFHDYPARLHPDGHTMSIASAATVLFALSGAFGSLVLVILFGALGALVLLAAVRRRSGLPTLRSRWPLRVVMIAIGVAAVTALTLVIAGSAIGV